MKVFRCGSGLAIRLPKIVAEALDLREGDDVTLHIAGKQTFEIEKAPSSTEFLSRLRKFRSRLPNDFKFSRSEANERLNSRW